MTRTYLFKFGAKGCPSGIASPKDAVEWEGQRFWVPNRVVRVGSMRSPQPENGDTAYLWINESSGGLGLSALVTLSELTTEPAALSFTAHRVQLLPNLGFRGLQGLDGVLKEIRAYALDQVRLLSDEDQEALVIAVATQDLRESESYRLPETFSRDQILDAIKRYNAGYTHLFSQSTDYDLAYGGKRYPPKAIVGIAAEAILGRPVEPSEFRGGKSTWCFRVLKRAGFDVVPKGQFGLAKELPAGKYFEGAVTSVEVNKYERDRTARAICIEHYGAKCQACGMDFESFYGEIGRGFIHVHHIVPISTIGAEYEVDPINDLRPVCPNCHAMLHRDRENPLTIRELSDMVGVSVGRRGDRE